jgi:serine/threonine protein phosphatase 1
VQHLVQVAMNFSAIQEPFMTRYAIGDIHGGATTFRKLLGRLNLQPGDQIYLLGDYVDRGNDSRGVLDIIMNAIISGVDMRPVRGNHDDMMWRCCTGKHDGFSFEWLECWGDDTLKSFGVSHPAEVPLRYVLFLGALPCIRYDDQFAFVHAGLNVSVDDPIAESSPDTMMWTRSVEFDSSLIQGRTLATGHNVHAMDEIADSLKTNHIFLDNGAFTRDQPDYGNLVALNLETRKLIVQPWLDGMARP